MSFTANRIRQGAAGAGGDYEIDNSLRFNDDDSAYLSWTPSSAGNRKTWTYSVWVKQGNVLSSTGLFNGGASSSAEMSCTFGSGKFHIYDWNGAYIWRLQTSAVFRDPSAWYHFVISVDTTQGTASDRVKIYVNGVQITALSTATYPSQNHDTYFNNTQPQQIGSAFGWAKLDGYLAEVNFIDGSALAPTDFGLFDATYGHWKAKEYTGSYAGNSFYLPFTNDTTNDHFNTVLYTGTGSDRDVNGVGFQPDLIWIKKRSSENHSQITDSVRGNEVALTSSLNIAEWTDGEITIESDGFSLDGGTSATNETSSTYVAWCWKAGGAASSNTNGSITSQVSANPEQGFSIIKFTQAGGAGQTIGHGLDSAPELIILKNATDTAHWLVYAAPMGNTKGGYLNLTNNFETFSQFWNNTSPTSSVITLGTWTNESVSPDVDDFIVYAWHSVAGYSKIGSYTGNGSTTGPTITTDFKVGWLMVKRTDATEEWRIFDIKRDPDGTLHTRSEINQYGEGSSGTWFSVGSTEFQVITSDGGVNASGGTYIYMAIADTSAIGDVTNDQSGLKNHWLGVNLTASDQMLDSPTNNFCTWNPLDQSSTGGTYAEGNLKFSTPTASTNARGVATIRPSTGKWYGEFLVVDAARFSCGVMNGANDGVQGGGSTDSAIFLYNRYTYYNSSQSGSYYLSAALANDDVISFALDLTNNILWYAINGTWQNSATLTEVQNGTTTNSFTNFIGSTIPISYDVGVFVEDNSGSNTMSGVANFGQDATFAGNKSPSTTYSDGTYGEFFYQPPSGFKALTVNNIPDPAVVPGKNFNALTYTGNGSTQSITGAGFQPDWFWGKSRSHANPHESIDVVRGVNKRLRPNDNIAEWVHSSGTDGFVSFDSDGFSLDGGGGGGQVNGSSRTYVSWLWKAGGTAVSNTNGSITSSVSANTNAGFSIVSYTGNATSGATVGHGLSKVPEMIVQKNRDNVGDWRVYHSEYGGTHRIQLNQTTAIATTADWNNTNASSSLFTLGSGTNVNGSGNNLIAYCFHSVDGFSKIGSYTGNGNADGSFIYTGFQPKYVLWKQTNGTGMWMIFDDARNTYNVMSNYHATNSSAIEASNPFVDFLSNGFKQRHTSGHANGSADTYMYMAFAEYPFKYSTAR
jgi:hypothetical protein